MSVLQQTKNKTFSQLENSASCSERSSRNSKYFDHYSVQSQASQDKVRDLVCKIPTEANILHFHLTIIGAHAMAAHGHRVHLWSNNTCLV